MLLAHTLVSRAVPLLQVVTWRTGDPLSGEAVTAGDVEFTIEQQDGEEMVVVAEPKQKAVKGEFVASRCNVASARNSQQV